MKYQQNELIKSFNALKEMKNIEFVEEENLFTLLTQLSETLYNQEKQKESSELQAYKVHKIKQDLKTERNKAIGEIALLRGSFL